MKKYRVGVNDKGVAELFEFDDSAEPVPGERDIPLVEERIFDSLEEAETYQNQLIAEGNELQGEPTEEAGSEIDTEVRKGVRKL